MRQPKANEYISGLSSEAGPLRRIATSPLLVALRLAALISVVLTCGAASADEPESRPENPHGDLKEPCGLCHATTAWRPARISREFDHARFGYPLRAAHAASDCLACHASLVFSEVGSACVSCHQDVHRGELGTDCGRCHTERSFIEQAQMRREHQLGRFPLRGGHATVECEECHAPVEQGRMAYVNLRLDCQGCHLDDYVATTSPNHTEAGFPTECDRCHNVVVWGKTRITVDVINHDANFFPIFSGSHRGEWVTCDECHVSRASFANFSCIFCHQHDDPVEAATDHDGVAGYRYESNACYSCHPQGEKQ